MIKSSKGILLYRSTRDGFTSQAFHSKCDGKGKTITIIKSNLDYVFGGYASSVWNSSTSYIRLLLGIVLVHGTMIQMHFYLVEEEMEFHLKINSLLNKQNMHIMEVQLMDQHTVVINALMQNEFIKSNVSCSIYEG